MKRSTAARTEQAEAILSNADRQHGLWLKLASHMQEQITLLRKQNDGDHEPVKTAHFRGRIAQLKALIALADDLPEVD